MACLFRTPDDQGSSGDRDAETHYQIAVGPMQALISSASRIVPMIETTIDPKHPRRFEKKTNMR